jgi:hypothetical protein
MIDILIHKINFVQQMEKNLNPTGWISFYPTIAENLNPTGWISFYPTIAENLNPTGLGVAFLRIPKKNFMQMVGSHFLSRFQKT